MTQVWQTSEQILAEYWILASIIHILAFRTDVGCFIKAIQTLLVAFSSETLWLRDWTEPRLVQNPHVVRTGPGAADTMRSFLPLAPFMWNTTSPHLRGRAEERRQRKEEESLGSETEEVSGAERSGWAGTPRRTAVLTRYRWTSLRFFFFLKLCSTNTEAFYWFTTQHRP